MDDKVSPIPKSFRRKSIVLKLFPSTNFRPLFEVVHVSLPFLLLSFPSLFLLPPFTPFFLSSILSLSALTWSAFEFFHRSPRFFFFNNSKTPAVPLFIPTIDAPFLPPSSLIYTLASCAPTLDYTFIPTTFFPSTNFAYKKLRCRGLFFLFLHYFPLRIFFYHSSIRGYP